MLDGGSHFKETKQSADAPESKSSPLEKLQNGLEKAASKIGEMFSDDFRENSDSKTPESSENAEKTEAAEKQDSNENKNQDNSTPNFKELFERLFSDDFLDNLKLPQEKNESDNSESNIEKPDPIVEKIAKSIGTPEGIKELIEKHPEKAELWKSQLQALETLNDPDASPAEIRSAQAKLSILKGQIMEVAVKDALAEAGFDVEAQQRVVEGESGGTRPDVIAVNNTDHPIEVFGISIQPGETISVECKCGGTAYMTNQLNNHIPNQLSGQEGTKVLLTTSDIRGVPNGLAASVCSRYDAKQVTLDVSVSSVEKAIKEVAEG